MDWDSVSLSTRKSLVDLHINIFSRSSSSFSLAWNMNEENMFYILNSMLSFMSVLKALHCEANNSDLVQAMKLLVIMNCRNLVHYCSLLFNNLKVSLHTMWVKELKKLQLSNSWHFAETYITTPLHKWLICLTK